MSYSVCIECREMVSAYEKYCLKCEQGKRVNPPDFWKDHDYSFLEEPKRTQEIVKDTLSADEIAQRKQALMEHFQHVENGANPNGNRAERRKYAALTRKSRR